MYNTKNTITRYTLPIVLIVAIFSVVVYLHQGKDDKFHLYFLNVGQGDAIFLETPGDFQILVDGGRSRKVLNELGNILSRTDKDIDLIIATHPDADHIGGLIPVLEKFEVGAVLSTTKEKETLTYKEFKKLAKDKVTHISTTQVIELSDGTIINILWPQNENSLKLEDNDTSIIIRIVNRDAEVLLTGDATKRIERILLNSNNTLESDILKAGHHGSKTSSDETFLKAVKPKHIIFSSSENNSYGHPHDEVVNLSKQIAETHRTSNGTVEFISINGADFDLKK